MTRPLNFLLIHSDQHRFDCLGVNGHAFLQTPHLDKLAAEGVNFTRAFCPVPVCTPARNSLLFGQWPTQHLAIANGDTEAPRPAREGLTSWSELLAGAGYQMGYVGKWGLDPRNGPTAYGFQDYVPEQDYAAWRAGQGLVPPPQAQGFFGETDQNIDAGQTRLAWGASRASDLLTRYAEADQPFFLRWDPSEPHLPNVVPQPYASLYPPAQIPPWPGYPDPLRGKPYAQAQQRRTWAVDGWTWEDWAPLVGRYLGEITLLDAQIGRLLSHLDALGLAENTVVIYTTDHGDMCGSHGMIDKHMVMYDDVVHVPLIVHRPGQAAPATCDAFVSGALDLAPTFCDLAGVPTPETFVGQSLLPLLDGAKGSDRDCIFSMYHGSQFGLYSQRMVRDTRWKYIWNATAEDELYDLAHDPGEIINLAAAPECRDELRRLRCRLVEWMEALRDPLCNIWLKPQLLLGRTQ